MLIAPSLLAADFSAMGAELARVREADAIHIDIMDGNFVPNLSMGPQMVTALRPKTSQIFDVHLMLLHPLSYIEVFRRAGADWLTFHAESADDPADVIRAIRESGAKPGMALRPATPAEALYPYGDKLYCATVMTVEPGFGGQRLITGPLEKVRKLKERFPHLIVGIDGGVNLDNAPLVRASGADLLVAGTAVFRSKDPRQTMARLRGQ